MEATGNTGAKSSVHWHRIGCVTRDDDVREYGIARRNSGDVLGMSEIKLVIAIPTAGMVRMGFAYSLAGLISKLAAEGIKTRRESTLLVKMDVQESSVIHSNRELLVSRALKDGQTHLLFLDDDMTFEPQIIDILAGRRQPVVAVNYCIKTEPPEFVAVGLDGERMPTIASSGGLYPIAYTGFGVSLFELSVFEKTPQPWFLPKFNPEANCYTTEDNPCYEKIREAGFPVYLDQDASKLVSHIGAKGWHWSQWKPPEKPTNVVELKGAA